MAVEIAPTTEPTTADPLQQLWLPALALVADYLWGDTNDEEGDDGSSE